MLEHKVKHMFGRKKQQWLKKAQLAQGPLSISRLAPSENPSIVASFLREKIGLKELEGFVSFDDETYIPTHSLQNIISRELARKGVVDICDLIDTINLPGELLEKQILVNTQDMDGFFDVIHRKFFTLRGAMTELKQVIGTKTAFDLNFLLNRLYWTEDYLEAILDLLAQQGFVGYIDPIKQRFYNFTPLNFSSSVKNETNLEYLTRFVNTSFELESEVSIRDISKLTRLSEENCVDFVEKNREIIDFVFSANFNYLYPVIDIVNQVLKDIFVYHDIPIGFWRQRLNVDRADLMNLLNILNQSLNGNITSEDFKAPLLRRWFEKGIDIEGLATNLSLDPLQLLYRVFRLSQLFQLRLIAGETSDPFLVKGIEHFEIFCQVDTSSYTDPSLYFECQNCRRIMCSNCRSTGSKHECPFCQNISAFIIDLPRYCPHCRVTFTHSYNLEQAEECYFCKKGPLELGWYKYPSLTSQASKMDQKLTQFLEHTKETKIPLQQIITFLGLSDTDTIAILEDHILHGKIQGSINIRNLSLQLAIEKEGFLCGVCETTRSDLERYTCNACGTHVCDDCYNEMSSVGMIFCPDCGENLFQRSG